MERRELLKRVGIVGGIGVGGAAVASHVLGNRGPAGDDGSAGGDGGGGGTPRQEPIRHADDFGTVVDAIEAGVDPDGDVPINGFLERRAADDTLLAFPPGTYRLQPVDLSGYTNLGLVAATEERPTFVATEGHCLPGGHSYVRFGDAEGFLLDRVEFDFAAANAGGVLRVTATGDATVSDVAVSGSCDGQVAMFRIDVLDPDATALVDSLRLENPRGDTSLTGLYVGRDHAGELTFRDCTISGFSDNGLYASAPGLDDGRGGAVTIEGGTYRNNNISNVRLGSDGSVARGVTSVSDEVPPTASSGPTVNVRWFRLRSGRDQRIADCEVVLTADSGFSYGGIVFHKANGGATVVDTTVEVDRDTSPAIRAFPFAGEGRGAPVFENVTVSGDADHENAVLIEGRDGTTFENCTIDQSGRERNGIYLRDSEDCRIVDSRIEATNNPLVLRGSTATVVNTTLVTPSGSRYIGEMEATDGDFTPQDTS